ncbi:hypothetical protein ACJJIE_01895 [Microbulbifer sp. TRSA001]
MGVLIGGDLSIALCGGVSKIFQNNESSPPKHAAGLRVFSGP